MLIDRCELTTDTALQVIPFWLCFDTWTVVTVVPQGRCLRDVIFAFMFGCVVKDKPAVVSIHKSCPCKWPLLQWMTNAAYDSTNGR